MSTNPPLLSVIMPAYNGAAFLREAVSSVSRTAYPLELILVDDGSTDATKDIARSLKNSLTYIREETNSGPSVARNVGLQAARGALISFLDADDLWADSHPGAALAYLDQHPEVDVVLGQIDYLIESATRAPATVPRSKPFHSYQVGAAIVRRRVWEKVGGFDPAMRTGEDVDWFLRIREAGFAMAMRPEVSLHYRLHAGNQPNLYERSRVGLLEACERAITRRRKTPVERENTQGHRPLVSVIVPAYNAAAFIAAAVESVLAQDYRPLEIIVVNDGSTDDTAEIVRGFPHVILVEQARRGTGAALNAGIKIARGEFLAFLDADDLWSREKLTRQMQIFGEHEGLEAVFAHVKEFHDGNPEQDVREIPGWITGTLLITRAGFDRVGPFVEAPSDPEGVEWYLRAIDQALRHEMLPEVLYRRRLHRTNRGIVDRDWGGYVRVVKAALDRRRSRKTDSHVEHV